MTTNAYQQRQIRRAKAILFSIAYLFGCYLLLPHGWETAGEVSVFLFALFFYLDTNMGKFLSFAALAANVTLIHSHLSKADFYIFSPFPDPDSKVYLLGFVGSFALAFVVMMFDSLIFEKQDHRADNPVIWVLVFLTLYAFIVPPPYRFAFVISCPFAVAAYKCRGVFRTVALLAIIASTVIFHLQNYFHLQFAFFLAFGAVFVAAYCLYLMNVAFAHEQLEKRS